MSRQHDDKASGRPGISELFDRFLNEEAALRGQIDKNARALAQTALSKLDVVSREEFDAQSMALARTQARVEELEAILQTLTEKLEQIEQRPPDPI